MPEVMCSAEGDGQGFIYMALIHAPTLEARWNGFVESERQPAPSSSAGYKRSRDCRRRLITVTIALEHVLQKEGGGPNGIVSSQIRSSSFGHHRQRRGTQSEPKLNAVSSTPSSGLWHFKLLLKVITDTMYGGGKWGERWGEVTFNKSVGSTEHTADWIKCRRIVKSKSA